MINGRSYLSLMVTSVHVSIQNKIHISVFAHPHDFDIMLGIIISFIITSRITETENTDQLIILHMIGPQISLLDKGNNISFCICFILYITVCHAQVQPAACHNGLFCGENLIRRPVEIKKPYPRLVITHPEKFFHLIPLNISLPILCSNIISNRDASGIFINIFNRRNPRPADFRCQVSPGHHIQAGMNIQIIKTVISWGIICFQISAQIPLFILGHSFLIEIIYEVNIFLRIKPCSLDYPGIIIPAFLLCI